MTAVMTSLLRIIIGCLRKVCRCCQRLPVQVIANNLHKTRTHFERGLTNLLLSTAITTAVLFSLRISFRITKEHGNLVRPRHSIIFLSLRKLSSSRPFSSVLFKNGTICFYKRLHKSSAYIYLIFKPFQIWLDFHRKCYYPKVLVVHEVYFFFFEKRKMHQLHFSFLSPRSLSLYKLRHEATPGARFPNLKSRSF